MTPFVAPAHGTCQRAKLPVPVIFYQPSGPLFKYQQNRSVMRLGFGQITVGIATVAGAMMLALNASARANIADPSGHIQLGKMKPEERYPFIAGMVEAIAFHRYTLAGKDAAVMNCVYDWFYKGDDSLETIYATLGKYPEYPPAAVINQLAKRKCGGE